MGFPARREQIQRPARTPLRLNRNGAWETEHLVVQMWGRYGLVVQDDAQQRAINFEPIFVVYEA